MSEIKLPKLCPRSEIEGKTIKKINCKVWDSIDVIILFTDNTFIHIGSRACHDGETEIELNNIADNMSDGNYERVLHLAEVPTQVISMLKEDYNKTFNDKIKQERERLERAEYERLMAKYGNQTTNHESRPQPDATSP